MFEEEKSEALCALDMLEKLGAANDAENTRKLLGLIDRDARWMDSDLATPDESDGDSELLETMLLGVCINSSRSDRVTESE